jgi:hypothetical protein
MVGVVHIASVVSDASATTDGAHAVAKGATTASGITVGGVAVTVDDTGVHALGTGAGTQAEQDQVDSALKSVGMQIALGPVMGKPQAGSVTYYAQSLVFVFTNPTGFTTTVVLGGANVSVAASPGFSFPLPSVPVFAPGAVAVGGTAPASAASSTSLPPPAAALGTAPRPSAAAPGPVLAALDLPEPGPIRTRTVLLVLAGAALVAAGLRRMPDEVLRAVQVDCPTEERS